MTIHDRALALVMSDPDVCKEICKIVAKQMKAKPAARPMTLTRNMRDLLVYIQEYTKQNEGVAPSYEEMKDAVGLASKSGIHRLITALEERGVIRRLANRARAIVCIEQEVIPAEELA